ncbi:hypothetical protein [Flavobacterium sp. N2270]|uniref:hypothetical protein n=1 Tax=Flavobacterium sp. N2270 TaxID=2986831 RepID=UPI002225297A|nr:hypothetical protein [Flavobacterium sp. N2270]
MKKKTIITGILGLFFLISCGPKRYKCGPGRRCEVKQNTIKTTIENQSFKKHVQNS